MLQEDVSVLLGEYSSSPKSVVLLSWRKSLTCCQRTQLPVVLHASVLVAQHRVEELAVVILVLLLHGPPRELPKLGSELFDHSHSRFPLRHFQ